MKTSYTSLKLVILYGATIGAIAIGIAFMCDKHQADNPPPTPAEVQQDQREDSAKFRAIRRAQNGESDYTIPDSALKK